jgi:hypothetical protein
MQLICFVQFNFKPVGHTDNLRKIISYETSFCLWRNYIIPGVLFALAAGCKKNSPEDVTNQNLFSAEFNGQQVMVASSRLGPSSGAYITGNSLTIVADGEYYVPIGRLYVHISNYTGPATYSLGNGGSFAYYKPTAGDTCYVEAGTGLGSVTVEHLDITSFKSDCPDMVFGGTVPCTLTTVDLGARFWFDAYSRNGRLMKVTKGSFFLRKTR